MTVLPAMEINMSFLFEHKDNSDLAWALGLKIASFLHLYSVVKWGEDKTKEGGSYDHKNYYTKGDSPYEKQHRHAIQSFIYVVVKVMFYPSLLCFRVAREFYKIVLYLFLEFINWVIRQLVWAFGSIFCFTVNAPLSLFSSCVKRLLDTIDIIVSSAFHAWDIVKDLSIHDLRQLLLCIVRWEPLPDELSSIFNGGGGGSSSVERGLVFNNDKNRTNSELKFHNQVTNGKSSFGGGHQEHWMEDKYLDTNEMKSLKRKTGTSLLLCYAEAPKAFSCSDSKNIDHVRRKLIYDIPLNPFQATVEQPYDSSEHTSDNDCDHDETSAVTMQELHEIETPVSIPQSPNRRAMAMNYSSILSDDVVYLARARLRLDENLTSEDTTTRVTADFLKRQYRLAVLNPRGTAGNIALSCGQHCATKIGPALYSSIRSMVPVLRNRYVFCQFSIVARELSALSLSIGLCTSDMPENTLVGTWKHSVGFSSTGQILLSSRWHSCEGTKKFGVGSIVGLLVFVDDSTVYKSWDGVKVTAYCIFSVDGDGVGAMVGPTEVHELRKSRLPLYCMDMDMTPTVGATEGSSSTVGCIELNLPENTDIYPTLTLQTPFTQVQCHFCCADLVLPSPSNTKTVREIIGAPPGVVVYGLDGSVVLSASDN